MINPHEKSRFSGIKWKNAFFIHKLSTLCGENRQGKSNPHVIHIFNILLWKTFLATKSWRNFFLKNITKKEGDFFARSRLTYGPQALIIREFPCNFEDVLTSKEGGEGIWRWHFSRTGCSGKEYTASVHGWRPRADVRFLQPDAPREENGSPLNWKKIV